MLLIQAKELECNGIPYRSAKRICFQGNSFERGLAFSKQLHQIADILYQEELAEGNACLIIDDKTHFTLWHQTTDLEQSEADQADISNQDTVQGFVQRFTAAKRTTLSQLAFSSEKSARQPSTAIIPPSNLLTVLLKQNSDPYKETTNQTVTAQPTQLKLDQQPPAAVVPTKPLTTLSTQDCSTITVDPFSCPW